MLRKTAGFIWIVIAVIALGAFTVFADDFSDEIVEVDDGLEEYYSEIPQEEDMFAQYVDSVLYGNDQLVSLDGVYCARDYLSDYNKNLYDFLLDKFMQIASGQLKSTVISVYTEDIGIDKQGLTAEELGVDYLFLSDGSLNPDAKSALNEYYGLDKESVINALQMDYPQYLFWYDKVASTSIVNFSVSKFKDSQGEYTRIGYASSRAMKFTFPVSTDYADLETEVDSKGRYLTVTSDLQRVAVAKENAMLVVEHFARYSDYSKLKSYADMVKSYSAYNSSAAASSKEYGDPWQLIYVFDGDPETKVVCEGYSKAFKYLCDLSEFDSEIGCITVIGTLTSQLSSGRHMWNIVNIGGLNRIVDITNYRSGVMFMPVPEEQGSVDFGYSFVVSEKDVLTYEYSEKEAKNLFAVETLQLTTEPLQIDFDKEVTDADHDPVLIAGYEATCIEDGLTDSSYCSFCGQTIQKQEIIPAKGHDWKEKTEREASYTQTGLIYHYCIGCDESWNEEPEQLKLEYPDGLANSAAPDGKWYYVVDELVDTTYCGSAANKYGTWFVENGVVNFSLNGLIQGTDGIWLVKEGRIDTSKTDVLYTEFEGESGWWNVVGGKLLQQETVANNSNGWWYINDLGRVDFGYKGLADNVHGTWYMENGRVTFDKTGVLFGKYKGEEGWWNIKGSRLVKGETVANNANGWWYIDSEGRVDFEFTGFAANSNGTWYLENGKVNFSKTDVILGTVNNTNGWWNVEGGRLVKRVTVAHNSNGWWYIGSDGKVNFNFKGIASNSNGSWYLENGKVNFGYSGRVSYNGKMYVIVGGKVQ